MKIPFIGSTKLHPSITANNQLSINCYEVPSEGGVSEASLVGSPGTYLYEDIPAGESRGLITCFDRIYAVIGTTLYEVEDGSYTDFGTVAGTGRVGMAYDDNYLVIVTGTGNPGYTFDPYAGTPTATPIADDDFNGADTVTYLEGFFIFTIGDDTWFTSDLFDATLYTASNQARNIRIPDKTLNMVGDHGELFAFNERSIDVWYLTENIDFPWEQNKAASIERGCYAKWSIVTEDNTIFFLGDDLMVYRLNGYTPNIISDTGVGTSLSNCSHSNLVNAYAFIYTDHGHKFYQLTVPNEVTWVFDVATKKWHTKKHYDLETHHAFDYVFFENQHIILDSRDNGKVLVMDRTEYQDVDTDLVLIRRGQFATNEDKILHWKKIKISMETGKGLALDDANIKIRHSDDRGKTWKGEKTLSYGKSGEYDKQVIRRHCGSSRVRQWEIEISEPYARNIHDVFGVVT